MKTFRLILMFLLLPVLVIAFYWEADLQLSETGHAIAQISIVLGICAFALKLFQVDEMDRLREINSTSSRRYQSDSENGAADWSYRVEMPPKPIIINKENDHRDAAASRNILDIRYPLPFDALEKRSRPVPKSVK